MNAMSSQREASDRAPVRAFRRDLTEGSSSGIQPKSGVRYVEVRQSDRFGVITQDQPCEELSALLGDVSYRQVLNVWNEMIFKGYLNINDEQQTEAQPGPTGLAILPSQTSPSFLLPTASQGRGGLTRQHMKTHENTGIDHAKEHLERNTAQDHYQNRVSFEPEVINRSSPQTVINDGIDNQANYYDAVGAGGPLDSLRRSQAPNPTGHDVQSRITQHQSLIRQPVLPVPSA